MAAHNRRAEPIGARTRRRRELQRRTRRSLGLTVLAVLPGAGLTRTRFRAIGWTLLSLLAVALIALAVATIVRGPRAMLDLALRIAINPTLLLVVAGAAVAAGLVWILSIILTNRGSEPVGADSSSKLGLRLVTGLMCLVVAAPVIQTVRYVSIQRELVGTVFAGQSPVVVAGGGALPTQTAKPAQADDPWKNVPRVNMLLIGSDAGDDRTGLRTDSMVVASIDTKTGITTLISLPRNLERVPFPEDSPMHAFFPDGYYCPGRGVGEECLLNAVWNEALGHKDLFPGDPNPGLTTLKAVIGEITGLKLDYTTIIDLAGFQSLVDAMGGVTVNVTERLPINGYHLNGKVLGIEGYIEPGRQKLDGFHALWYARSRLLSDDYSRMRRQRCLVGALLDQVNPATMLAKYPQLAQVAKQNITTDVGLADLPAWVDLVERIQKGGVRSLTFTVEVIDVGRPDFPKMRQLVADAINPPAVTPPSTSSGAGPSTSSPTTPPSTTSTTPAPDSTSAVNVKDAC